MDDEVGRMETVPTSDDPAGPEAYNNMFFR